MAAIAEMPTVTEPAQTKKGRSKRALKPKNPSSSEDNIVAGTLPEPSPVAVLPSENSAEKENHESLSKPKKTKKGVSKGKQQQPSDDASSFEKQLQEMQEQLEKLKLEKEKTEETLKAKEEELETRDREQEKLKVELKKLQKAKEFKPTLTFPSGLSLNQDQEKKEKKTKKPSPPYVLWCKDQWNEVKKGNTEADFKEMSNQLGAKWKTITAEEKKPYEEKYQAEKEAYLKIVGNEKREQEAMKLLEEEQKHKTAMELLEQYLQFKQEAEKDTKKPKKEKDPLKPKQPMSAYFVFANERRAALLAVNKSMIEVAKMTGEEWKNMPEKDRAPYEEMALKNREQYAQEMEVYKQKKEEESASLKKEGEEIMKVQKQEAMQLLKKKEKTETLIKKTKEKRLQQKKEKKIVDPNKPKKPASSFLLYSKDARKKLAEERPGVNNSTITALISVQWKEISEEEKNGWNEKAAEAMVAYKKELEVYNQKLAAEEAQSNEED